MTEPTLRELAQVVVDASNRYAARLDPGGVALDAAEQALSRALGLSSADYEAARAILTALDAERRQQTRAMIAALYWQAWEAGELGDSTEEDDLRRYHYDKRDILMIQAGEMERSL